MTIKARLDRLRTIWPPALCRLCEARPAVVCVADADAADRVPDYPEGRCSHCGQLRYSVVVLVGLTDDDI